MTKAQCTGRPNCLCALCILARTESSPRDEETRLIIKYCRAFDAAENTRPTEQGFFLRKATAQEVAGTPRTEH